MITYEVRAIEGRYCVDNGSDQPAPITRGGEPAVFHDGWAPIGVVTNAASIHVLCLQHVSGGRSVWYLDRNYNFITNSVGSLDQAVRASFLDAVTQLVREAWEQLICSPDKAGLNPQTGRSLSLLRGSLPEVLAETGQDSYTPSTLVRLNDRTCADLVTKIVDRVPHPAAFVSFLYQLLERDFLKDVVAAAKDGQLTLPSPIDGKPLSTDIGLCINPGTVAYRFTDTQHRLTFYVIGSLWRITMAAIYIPELGLTIYRDQLNQQHLDEFVGGALDRAFFTHVLSYAAEIDAYLAAPRRTMTLVYLQEHLGHHLFNELGGLSAVVDAVPRKKIPDVIMLNASNSEMYGKIDQIFPALADKVDRKARNPEQLMNFAYNGARCLLRPTDDYVPTSLAARIIELNENDPWLDSSKKLFALLSAENFLIVMFGLRVENRTVVDQLGFYSEITDYLREHYEKVAIVLDGHNGIVENGKTAMFRSHREGQATKSPMEVETDIVQALRDKYADDGGLAIISTIGAPMSASIYWCNRSAFFVTPWGAGLAKYRWVCNRPGLVVAGQKFFRSAGYNTIHLYDSPEIMEAPTPLSFVTEDEVEDEPQATLLVDFDDGNRVNFTVRPDALRARLGTLLSSVGL